MARTILTATPRKAHRRTPCQRVCANNAPRRDGLSSPGRLISIGVRWARCAAGGGVDDGPVTTAETASAGNVLAGWAGSAFGKAAAAAGRTGATAAGWGAVFE